MKLLRKIWLVIEVMTIEQMKPNGKYMQNWIEYMQNWIKY